MRTFVRKMKKIMNRNLIVSLELLHLELERDEKFKGKGKCQVGKSSLQLENSLFSLENEWRQDEIYKRVLSL